MATVPSLNPAVLAAREKLQQGRQRLREQHEQGSPGIQVCAGLTELYDEIILDLYQAALAELALDNLLESPSRWSPIVATVGERLLPIPMST